MGEGAVVGRRPREDGRVGIACSQAADVSCGVERGDELSWVVDCRARRQGSADGSGDGADG
jgi:hypothetical protein